MKHVSQNDAANSWLSRPYFYEAQKRVIVEHLHSFHLGSATASIPLARVKEAIQKFASKKHVLFLQWWAQCHVELEETFKRGRKSRFAGYEWMHFAQSAQRIFERHRSICRHCGVKFAWCVSHRFTCSQCCLENNSEMPRLAFLSNSCRCSEGSHCFIFCMKKWPSCWKEFLDVLCKTVHRDLTRKLQSLDVECSAKWKQLVKVGADTESTISAWTPVKTFRLGALSFYTKVASYVLSRLAFNNHVLKDINAVIQVLLRSNSNAALSNLVKQVHQVSALTDEILISTEELPCNLRAWLHDAWQHVFILSQQKVVPGTP